MAGGATRLDRADMSAAPEAFGANAATDATHSAAATRVAGFILLNLCGAGGEILLIWFDGRSAAGGG